MWCFLFEVKGELYTLNSIFYSRGTLPEPTLRVPSGGTQAPAREQSLGAEVSVGLATDTTLYLIQRGAALEVNFHHPRFSFIMATWAPRAPSFS